jgi:hypothetical protein
MQQRPDAAWLEALVHDVHAKVELANRNIQLLAPVHITHLTQMLPLTPELPLLVVPWGKRQVNMESLYHLLNLDNDRVSEWETLARPDLAPATVFPLGVLGCWSGSSNANLPRLIPLFPGWDEQISVSEQIFFLRRPDSVLPSASPELAYALQMFEKKGIDAQYDTQLYCTYLARVLIAIVDQVAEFLCSREEYLCK